MQFSEIKAGFMKSVVTHGFTSLQEVPEEYKTGVPPHVLERWMSDKNHAVPARIPNKPRLVNGFAMGADPELSFMLNGVHKSALDFGLQTGLAFGIDMNGRLAELRPKPSRFCLDIVASVLAELRWMAMFHPQTLQFQWVAKAFNGQDGIGGHVHLARKRCVNGMNEEIRGLSHLYSLLTYSNVFDKANNDTRQVKTKYGKAGDYRFQRHGYEYRGFPTWLDSPWLAYFVLVMSKLTMVDPELVFEMYRNTIKSSRLIGLGLTNLLSYYKNVDDDAWIAYNALSKWGLPGQGKEGMDIKANWGILYPEGLKLGGRPSYYPGMIDGSPNDKQDVFNYLVKKEPIPPGIPLCTWGPQRLPDGYTWLPTITQTYHKIGLGEIVSDLVCNDALIVQLNTSDHPNMISVEVRDNRLEAGLAALKGLVPGTEIYRRGGNANIVSIFLPGSLRTNELIPQVKKVLTSGLFPIWKVQDVQKDSFANWFKQHQVKAEKFIGKELIL